ncbi:MAG: plasmid stabilization protein [Cyanobacteria bacterium P01_E01_bin.6]
MTITLDHLSPQLAHHLQQRATQNGRTIEAEITEILATVLLPHTPEKDAIGLATAIRNRFAEVGGVDLPEIPREPIRNPPTF